MILGKRASQLVYYYRTHSSVVWCIMLHHAQEGYNPRTLENYSGIHLTMYYHATKQALGSHHMHNII